ncbi:MAG: replication-associated recombination protein A, partial [Patescibacteria group bacterium]
MSQSNFINLNAPLADRLRPRTLDDFAGQEKIIGAGKILRQAIEQDRVPSIIFWGPPGCGKTTLARIIANLTQAEFVPLSAVASGVKDIRREVAAAAERRKESKKTIIFIDEIHRFNKGQQDALLPYVENGVITLIGATTENPSFEVISALLSRCRVFVLEKLTAAHIQTLVERALKNLPELKNVKIEKEALEFLSQMSDGDARVALNALELAAQTSPLTPLLSKERGAIKGEPESSSPLTRGRLGGGEGIIGKKIIEEALQKSLLYDKVGEEHYNIISALHKAMRGGNADAALYWLARMLAGGEDPLYIARRLIRFASEDIGIANSLALPQAVAAYQACHYIGMP